MNVRKLAELTDVSVATISRVLKGEPVVNPETRDRVLQTLAQHPFYPDLKKKKKKVRNLFVFLSPTQTNEQLNETQVNFFSRSLAGVRSHFDQANSVDGLERYLILSSFHSGKILEKLAQLEELDYAGSIAGIFIIHTQKEDDKNLALYTGNLKLYLLGRSHEVVPNERVDCVYFDDLKVGHLAYEHLVSNGHKHILILSGPKDFTYFALRERAFREASAEDGLKLQFRNTHAVCPEAAYLLAKSCLQVKDTTAVFVTAEILLEGVLRYLDEEGIRIPGDLSLLSANDFLIGYQHTPPVSVIRTPHFEIGRLAAVIALENLRFEYKTSVDYKLDVLLNDRKSVAKIHRNRAGGEV